MLFRIARLAEEHERAFLVADDNVRRFVIVQIHGGNLRTDSGIVVDLVRDKLYSSVQSVTTFCTFSYEFSAP